MPKISPPRLVSALSTIVCLCLSGTNALGETRSCRGIFTPQTNLPLQRSWEEEITAATRRHWDFTELPMTGATRAWVDLSWEPRRSNFVEQRVQGLKIGLEPISGSLRGQLADFLAASAEIPFSVWAEGVGKVADHLRSVGLGIPRSQPSISSENLDDVFRRVQTRAREIQGWATHAGWLQEGWEHKLRHDTPLAELLVPMNALFLQRALQHDFFGSGVPIRLDDTANRRLEVLLLEGLARIEIYLQLRSHFSTTELVDWVFDSPHDQHGLSKALCPPTGVLPRDHVLVRIACPEAPSDRIAAPPRRRRGR